VVAEFFTEGIIGRAVQEFQLLLEMAPDGPEIFETFCAADWRAGGADGRAPGGGPFWKWKCVRQKIPETVVVGETFLWAHEIPLIQFKIRQSLLRRMILDGDTGLCLTTQRMGFRNRKEELPSFEVGARATGCQTFGVDSLHGLERGIRLHVKTLSAEFCIHVIVNSPEPFWESGRVTRNGIGCNVFGETLATVFAWENVGERFKEGANVVVACGSCCKTD
jgi:hypothetical protein